jgi:hypothetical protein
MEMWHIIDEIQFSAVELAKLGTTYHYQQGLQVRT